jgi:hypothetical protein
VENAAGKRDIKYIHNLIEEAENYLPRLSNMSGLLHLSRCYHNPSGLKGANYSIPPPPKKR